MLVCNGLYNEVCVYGVLIFSRSHLLTCPRVYLSFRRLVNDGSSIGSSRMDIGGLHP